MQMIIYTDFFLSTRFFPIFLFIRQQISYFPPTNIIFSFKTFLLLLLRILGSMFNLFDLSRTMCSFFLGEPAYPHIRICCAQGRLADAVPAALSLFFPFVFIFHFSLVFPVVRMMRINLATLFWWW